jgi:carbamoyl-phosphate synthase small subunit
MLGICLGHQLIAEAFEARTYKLPFGHHGANHPVADVETGRVFVTSQNHGFAVDPDSLPESVQLWLRNSNDGTVEGLKSPEQRVWSAQFHPEAAPGPWDCRFILEDYVGAVRTYADGSEEGHAYAGST